MPDASALRATFPLDLTCPKCGAVPVTFTIDIPVGGEPTVAVEVSCTCGQHVNYGSLPAEFTREGNPVILSKQDDGD